MNPDPPLRPPVFNWGSGRLPVSMACSSYWHDSYRVIAQFLAHAYAYHDWILKLERVKVSPETATLHELILQVW